MRARPDAILAQLQGAIGRLYAVQAWVHQQHGASGRWTTCDHPLCEQARRELDGVKVKTSRGVPRTRDSESATRIGVE